jgi:hypothetical protein
MTQNGVAITSTSASLADVGVYSMVIVATMTGFTDSTKTYTATVVNPCLTATLTWTPNAIPMSNSKLAATVS